MKKPLNFSSVNGIKLYDLLNQVPDGLITLIINVGWTVSFMWYDKDGRLFKMDLENLNSYNHTIHINKFDVTRLKAIANKFRNNVDIFCFKRSIIFSDYEKNSIKIPNNHKSW